MKLKIMPLMRGCTLAACLACCSLMAYGQSPCKNVKETTDEWTKKTMQTAQLLIGNPFASRKVILQQSEGKFYFGLLISYNMDFPDVVFKQGDKVTFKLANEEVIEVTALKDIKPTILRDLDVPSRNWFVNQEVEPAVFAKLAASPITAIKYRLNDSDLMLPEIKDRQTRKIMETADCMLKNNQ